MPVPGLLVLRVVCWRLLLWVSKRAEEIDRGGTASLAEAEALVPGREYDMVVVLVSGLRFQLLW